MLKSRCWLLLVLFALSGVPAAVADIYRWVDDAGTVHFGNRPPENAKEVRVLFQEIPSGAPSAPAGAPEQPSTEAILQEFEQERRQEAERAAQKAQETGQGAPASREELIAGERSRLEEKIRELEQMPLEQFGSQRNKRARIGFYEYRLQDLINDPDGYFRNPVTFEGNVLPVPENTPTN
jgi:hypothetical protein